MEREKKTKRCDAMREKSRTHALYYIRDDDEPYNEQDLHVVQLPVEHTAYGPRLPRNGFTTGTIKKYCSFHTIPLCS